MAPVGPLLWRTLRVYQVYGANTEVGKTVFTTILSKASSRIWKDEKTAYLKPVSTGPQDEADDRHIAKYIPGVARATLLQYGRAVSPHIAARGQHIPSDQSLLHMVRDYATGRAATSPGWLFVETAGGVHSPGPSGTSQADLYIPLRCPVILIGDSKLGGVSSTISAFESLKIRGVDVEVLLLFQDMEYENYAYLAQYFKEKYNIPVVGLPKPPARVAGKDEEAMSQYYLETSQHDAIREALTLLDEQHKQRVSRLDSMAASAHKHIWYPFTQQKLISADDIVTIDSAQGDYLQTLSPRQGKSTANDALLQPSFDGSASWWTQGLGHANPSLTMAAAYAAGRYGHVMFAGAVHEPALTLAETLLEGLQNPRLTRVFFSDNGSTGMEVAVKMALRATKLRYGWSAETKMGIIGLEGGYHGDTIGAMNCSAPSTFNEKVDWYEGKGIWLDYPSIQCIQGRWVVKIPNNIGADLGEDPDFENLSDVFDINLRESRNEHKAYERYILTTLRHHIQQGRKFGALVIEPVVLGAGGMILVDPLFQRTLVNVIRRNADLFGAEQQPGVPDEHRWTGLPIVFDEVFTGLYRLGRFSSSSFLDTHADISVHAKLLTGGLVPLCTTLASESIFRAFESTDKSDALLHGHSYTAHPVGCQVAVESLRQMRAMEERGHWDWAKSSGWAEERSRASPSPGPSEAPWSIWPRDFIDWVSHSDRVAGTWALGSVLSIHMRTADGAGYKSTAASELQSGLLRGSRVDSEGGPWNVHSRVLGNVLYIMGGQKTTRDEVEQIAGLIRRALLQ
ncbi:PLP-dependent transferase [Xylariaceae sp. FL1272]|nr:PLP-dependent transferase [Xylariaceae sp. FL1272]